MSRIFTVSMNKDRTISIDIEIDIVKTIISEHYKPQTLSENESYQKILKNRKFLNKDECFAIITGLYTNEKTDSFLEKFIREKIISKIPEDYFKTDGELNYGKISETRESLKTSIKKVIEESKEYERELINNLFPTERTKRISSLKLFEYAQENNLELPRWFINTQTKMKLDQQKRIKEKEERNKLKKKIKKRDTIIEQKDREIEKLKAANKRLQENNKKRFTKRFYLLGSYVCCLHKNNHEKHSCPTIAKKIEDFTGQSMSDETVRTTMKEVEAYFDIPTKEYS